jgi:hypothetical protein
MAITLDDLRRAGIGTNGMNPNVIQVADMSIRGLPQNAPQQAPQPMPQQMPQQQPRRGLLGGLFGPEGRDARARLAIGLEGLTMNPNQALIGQLQSGIEERKVEAERNRTLEYLSKLNTPQAARALEYAQATGDVVNALKMALEPEDMLAKVQLETAQITLQKLKEQSDMDPNVQQSAPLPDQSGVVLTMRNGTVQVRTVGGEVLSGQAAMDFVKTAQENAANYQRSIYEARRTGTLNADVLLGGDAARVVAEGAMAPVTAKEYFKQAENVGSSIRSMDSAIQAINEGAQSGVVYDMLPNVTVASAELQNAKSRLGLDVIGSVTFGALSAGEMSLAMDTAVPSGLPPQELKVWLTRKREAQRKMLMALQEAAIHFASGGTQEEYYRMIGAQTGAGVGTNAGTGAGATVQPTLTYNPATGVFE